MVKSVAIMDNAQEKLIENLKKQLEEKHIERLGKQYLYAIQTVATDILNEPKKPLTFISGSSTIHDIDNMEYIVNQYTSYVVNVE